MDNIYCKHYLLSNKTLLQDPEFKDFFINIKNSYYFNNDHICIHIKDSIHYKVLSKELPFELYNKYITITNQPEHSLEKYKNLINLYKENNHIFISDGCHRLAILYFIDVPINEKYLSFSS